VLVDHAHFPTKTQQMTGALLRTGNLKAFEPLGALGNPVYLAAAQLRVAIGRRLGKDAADALAIPHRNQDGDTVDWYAHEPGPVVPWSAATPEERAQAKEKLLAIRERIEDLGRTMQSEEAGERQVFGRLLEHVTSFPGDDCVYLVDGRPVITFWGFQHQNSPVGSIPLLNLDVSSQDPPAQEERRGPSWWWLLPLLLLLGLLLVWLLRGCDEPPFTPVDPGLETSTREESSSPEVPPPQPDEAPIEEAAEPDPEVYRDRTGVVVRDGETRILENDGAVNDQRVISEDSVDIDQVGGDAREDAAPPVNVESADLVDADTDGTQIEVDEADTLTDQPAAEETGTEDLDLVEGGLDDTADGAADALPEVPAEEVSGGEEAPEQPLSEETSEDGSAPEQAEEPPPPAEETGNEPPPGDTPDSGAPDPLQPGEPATSEAAETQGDSGEPDASTDGQRSEPPASPQGDPAQSLNLPPGAVGRGSTRFLNGGWRTSTSLQDPRTALPVDMEYRLEDGMGSLRLRRSDGSVCSGQVKAVIEGGKLVIQNARDIRCPDGTNFGRPRLECTPGDDGRADCSGRYETGEVFSVDIKKSGD
jgi:hypothetical protein